MEHRKIGFAFCGSFCTYSQAMEVLERVQSRYGDVLPIVSEAGAATDTRFGAAHDFMREMERICGRRVVDSIAKAEPIGPRHLLDVLVICPCTGNTLAKLANGVTDTTVTMAAKAHLRNGGPVVLAPPPTTVWRPRPGISAYCWTRKTSISSPSGRTIPPRSPPPWWPTFPWSQPLSTRRWRAASSSPCCLDRRRRIKKHTAPGRSRGRCVFVIVYRVLAKSMGI